MVDYVIYFAEKLKKLVHHFLDSSGSVLCYYIKDR